MRPGTGDGTEPEMRVEERSPVGFAVAANADAQLNDALAPSAAASEALVAAHRLVEQTQWVSCHRTILVGLDAKED